MCLEYSKKYTETIKKKFKGKKKITCYKVINNNGKAVIRPYHYKAGWNKSNRINKEYPTIYDDDLGYGGSWLIRHGIHVFTNKRNAVSYCADNEIVLPVQCYLDDLVAAGKNNCQTYGAVFMKVFVTKKDARKLRE